MKYYFVYNAKSGLFNQLTDAAHKAISPNTYECNLCKLTYGLTSMKKQWKAFIKNYDIEFTYKNKIKVKETPAVYDEQLMLVISSKEISACKDVQELQSLVAGRLKKKEI
jgi:hypothetical protein